MSDVSSTDTSPRKACYMRLLYLKFAMAGDIESAVLIDQLLERLRSIDWNDPAFISFTQDMRAGIPEITDEQIDQSGHSLKVASIINAQREVIAEANEDVNVCLLKAEEQSALLAEILKNQEWTNQIERKMWDFYRRAIVRLGELGEDPSPYVLRLDDLPPQP